jgi:flagellar basal body-associated protein FliL
MKKMLTILMTLLITASLPSVASEHIDPNKPGYIVLIPIVTNYISEKPNHLSYVKVDVSIAIDSQTNMEAAQHYVPEIRNAIVFLLNQQGKFDLDSPVERQILANKGLELVQGIYLEEMGETWATDFLWGFFAIQN